MTLLERLREAQDELDAARKVRPNRCGSELMARDEWAGDALPALLAVVEAVVDPFLFITESLPDAEPHVDAEMRRAADRLRAALASLDNGDAPASPPKEVSGTTEPAGEGEGR